MVDQPATVSARQSLCACVTCANAPRGTPALEESSTPDLVHSPPHYTRGGIETRDFIAAKGLNFNRGNIVKYVTRAGLKHDELEDLRKALSYLEHEIALLERDA